MTHKNFVWGTLALGLVFMMTVAGCEDGSEDSGGGGSTNASANYIANQPADVQNYPSGVTFFATRDAAKAAFVAVVAYTGSFAGMLSDAYEEASDEASPNMLEYMVENGNNTSGRISYAINDTDKLKAEASVTAASISGNSAMSFGGNVKLSDLQGDSYTWKNGDTSTNTSAINFTMNITNGFYTFSTYWNVAGILEYSSSSSMSESYKKDAENRLIVENVYSGEDSGGVLLTIYNTSTNKGGKFKMSYAYKANGSDTEVRNAGNVSSSDTTNLQVYDNAGTLKYTFFPSELGSVNLAGFFSRINPSGF